VRKVVAAIVAAGIAAALMGWVGASAAPSDHRQERSMRLLVGDGYNVENDPSGPSGGDLFGASGEIGSRGHRPGKWSSACILSPPVGGQCQLTLILRPRRRIQLAGNIRIQGDRNRLSIVGGTGKFRGARGDATLEAVGNQGAIQRLHLTILR
jgi:Dirigent-like protein